MKIIRVKLKENPYNIYIGQNCLNDVPGHIKRLGLGDFGLIITSSRIASLYNKLIKDTFGNRNFRIITVIDGEKAKSKKWLFKVIEEIMKADKLNKKLFIICMGGGVVGDLGGFAASIYKRGIPYVQIPTTLLGQIDSSIGGKTGIDMKTAKNILGTFYQPKAVFIDPVFLATLPSREIKQGIAEAIKYGIISDKDFFYFLKNNHKKIMHLEPSCILKIISVCAGIKAKIVGEDENEKKGLRTILNFGHTFAHAIESSLQYKKIPHGEAVSIGMLYAARLSFLLKKCSKEDTQKILEIIKLFSLPTKINLNYLTLYESLSYDKKFISGKIRMVLLKKIGQVEVIDGISRKNIKKVYTLTSKKKYGILKNSL